MDDEQIEQIVAQVDQALTRHDRAVASLGSAVQRADELGDVDVSRAVGAFNCVMGQLVAAYSKDPGNEFLAATISHVLQHLAGEVE